MQQDFNFKSIKTTIIALLNKKDIKLANILKSSDITTKVTDYDNWNGGTDVYTIYVNLDLDKYSEIEINLAEYENALLSEFQFLIRDDEHRIFGNLIIKPVLNESINWSNLDIDIKKNDILKKIDNIKSIMVSVAADGPRINTVNPDYIEVFNELAEIFRLAKLENPNNFNDLWKWYGKWSSGDLPSYQSRREFISNLYCDVINLINASPERKPDTHHYELTGWNRVDRSISELRKRTNEANTEEQFQAIGLLGRETLISLAQEVYNANLHKPIDDVIPSKTDAYRMLAAYITTELRGGKNELLRKHTKSTLSLANHLTHKRTATRDDAALCLISVMSLVNTIKIISKKSIIYF